MNNETKLLQIEEKDAHIFCMYLIYSIMSKNQATHVTKYGL